MERGIIYLIFVIWNVVVFLIYGLDKFLAKNNMWRISEKILLTTAMLGGGIGAFAGMKFFRHKTKHKNFTTLLPIFAVLSLVILFYSDASTK